MDWYPLAVLTHVLAALVAVGSSMTYVIWLRLAGRDRARLAFVLASIRYLDQRLAMPAYGVLMVSGVVIVASGRWSFRETWLEAALALYIALMYLAILVFRPAIQRLTEKAAADPTSPAYAREARFSRAVLVVIAVVLALMVVDMVLTPTVA